MDTTQINHNNSGQKYRIAVDIAKEGSHIWDLTPYFKGRVGDNNFGLQVTWYYQGQLMNVVGMKPYIEGLVGQYSFDKNGEIDMDPDAVPVRYDGSTDDCEEAGKATFYFPSQMFPQEGIFKGFIGVKDDRDDSNNPQISGVTIWFKVLPGIAQMGHACDAYVDELDKALQDFKEKLDEHDKNYQSQLQNVIDDARNTYESETKNAHDSLDALNSQIQANRDEQQNLSQRLAGTEQQIATHDVVTRPEFNNLSNQLTQQVSQMRQSGLEFFDNADALKKAYPQGANKLCVTLNDSHQWVYDYINSVWNDAGTFSFGSIDPQLMNAFYLKNPANLLANSDFNTLNQWELGRDKADPNAYVDTEDSKNGSNVLVMNGYLQDGTTNESWAKSSKMQAEGHQNISIAVEANVSSINYQVGDTAKIEIDWVNKNGETYSSSYNNIQNSGDTKFHRITWNNILIPADAVQFYIAFTMTGLGQVKIRRPQINYGENVLPYADDELINMSSESNCLLAYPICKWNDVDDNSAITVDEDTVYNGQPTVHIKNEQTIGNYIYPISPFIKINSNELFSMQVPIKGNWDISKGKVFAEINQYKDSPSTVSPLPFDNYDTATINPSDKWEKYSFDNIKLEPDVKYITIRFVVNGTADVNVGNITFSENKYGNKENVNRLLSLAEKSNPLINYPIVQWYRENNPSPLVKTNYSLLSDGRPTLSIHPSSDAKYDQYLVVDSPFIPVNSKLVQLGFEAKVSGSDWANGNAYVEIRQYTDANYQYDVNRNIDIYLKNNDALEKFTLSNILLFDDTKFISVAVVVQGNTQLDIGDISLSTLNLADDLKLNPLNWDIYNSQLATKIAVTEDNQTREVQIVQSDSNYVFPVSPKLNLDAGANYTLKIPVIIKSGTAFIELDFYKSDFSVSQAPQYSIDNSENTYIPFTMPEDAEYVDIRLVIKGTGTLSYSDSVELCKQEQGKIQTDLKKPLPRLEINAHANITDSWTAAPFVYADGTRTINGYLQFSIQGDSSRLYPKKNLKIKCFEDSNLAKKLNWKPKSDWTANSKFNIKANWIDATQSRNLVNADLFSKASAIMPFEHNSQAQLYEAPKLGQMEGFPIELYFNDNYYGLMSFNTKGKDAKMYALDKNNPTNEALFISDGNVTFDNPSDTIDQQKFDTVVHDQANPTLKENLSNFQVFVRDSTDTDFKNKIGTYIDVKSAINCMLWGALSNMIDSYNKSIVLLTWNNGLDFYMTFYDLDSTWNLWWDGSKLISDPLTSLDSPFSFTSQWGNALFNRLYKNFKSEIKVQWSKLRSNVWRNDQLIGSFRNYIKSIPEAAFERDQAKWPGIPSKSITSFEQIQQAIIDRGNAMDKIMENLVPTVDPIENLQNQINQLKNNGTTQK